MDIWAMAQPLAFFSPEVEANEQARALLFSSPHFRSTPLSIDAVDVGRRQSDSVSRKKVGLWKVSRPNPLHNHAGFTFP